MGEADTTLLDYLTHRRMEVRYGAVYGLTLQAHTDRPMLYSMCTVSRHAPLLQYLVTSFHCPLGARREHAHRPAAFITTALITHYDYL